MMQKKAEKAQEKEKAAKSDEASVSEPVPKEVLK